MDRLTYRPKEPYISDTSGETIKAYSDYDAREIIHRLADYEDTNLTPKQIDALNNKYNVLNNKYAEEYRKLDREYIEQVKEKIPKALYDSIADRLSNDQCYSIWIYCLECLVEMADAWEEVNGEDLIYVPAHFEKKKEEVENN